MTEPFFDIAAITAIGPDLLREIDRAYSASVPIPAGGSGIPPIPAAGRGMKGLPELWAMIVDRSTHLGSPWMSGHMDTAPHPAAALTQALVAALNNNLLFRELSPFASAIEDQLIGFFREHLGLGSEWQGCFASGGSLANLTGLFAAVGGFSAVTDRENVHLLMPASGHLSLSKSANVLGVSNDRIHKIACNNAGRVDLDALRGHLQYLPRSARPIVVSVLGSTIHGSVDDVEGIGKLCRNFGAWHHVDAIYGTALALSKDHRRFLAGLSDADSIVLGPQKWMYVPRVSAICLIRGEKRFDEALGTNIPYSLGGLQHRGRWGLQGSRPADAVVLWATLQTVGTNALGAIVDHSIALTQGFHAALCASDLLRPTHRPDLNLQTFRLGACDQTGERLAKAQARLAESGRTWVSVSRWRDEALMRAVLLSPVLTDTHLTEFVADIERAAA